MAHEFLVQIKYIEFIYKFYLHLIDKIDFLLLINWRFDQIYILTTINYDPQLKAKNTRNSHFNGLVL
jgi:hypothetical protein